MWAEGEGIGVDWSKKSRSASAEGAGGRSTVGGQGAWGRDGELL